jgi:hypothetical protein
MEMKARVMREKLFCLVLLFLAAAFSAGAASADPGGTAAGRVTVSDGGGVELYFRPGNNGAAFAIASGWRGAPGVLNDDPAVARPIALAALDKAYSRYPKADYSDAEWAQIQAAYNSGKSEIAAAGDYPGIQTALAAAAEAMAGVTASYGNRDIRVAVTVEKFILNGGYIVEPTLYTVKNHALASNVVLDALKARYPGVTRPYKSSGTPEKNFYLSGVYDPDYKGPSEGEQSFSGYLSEMDEGSQSGWMYAVNNGFPGVGAAAFSLIDGDVVRWQYTKTGLGSDIGADNSAWGADGGVTTADKDKLTWRVAEINTDDNKGDYGTAYEKAIAVLSRITSTQAEVDAALANLKTPSGNGNDDNNNDDDSDNDDPNAPGDGNGDTSSVSWEDITDQAGIPSAVDEKIGADFAGASESFSANGVTIAKASDVREIIASGALPRQIADLGKNVGSFLRVVDGRIEANERALIAAIEVSSSLSGSVDADKPVITANPVSVTASARGSTVIIPIPVSFKKLADAGAATFKDIVILKLKDDGSLLTPSRKSELAGISREGDYVIKDDTGETVNDGTPVSGSGTYYVCIAVRDGGAYDWDETDSDAHIFDPICAGVAKNAVGGGNDQSGGGSGEGGGGGGCDSGAFLLAALLGCAAIAATKRAE